MPTCSPALWIWFDLLRYFNVFGPRQDPNGAYAAVIPKWTAGLIANQTVFINGDGKTSRTFVYVANALQANLLAATTENQEAVNQVYNVAVGDRTTLNDLYSELRRLLAPNFSGLADGKPNYREFRQGDVRHSQADIGKAVARLSYAPRSVSGGTRPRDALVREPLRSRIAKVD